MLKSKSINLFLTAEFRIFRIYARVHYAIVLALHRWTYKAGWVGVLVAKAQALIYTLRYLRCLVWARTSLALWLPKGGISSLQQIIRGTFCLDMYLRGKRFPCALVLKTGATWRTRITPADGTEVTALSAGGKRAECSSSCRHRRCCRFDLCKVSLIVGMITKRTENYLQGENERRYSDMNELYQWKWKATCLMRKSRRFLLYSIGFYAFIMVLCCSNLFTE